MAITSRGHQTIRRALTVAGLTMASAAPAASAEFDWLKPSEMSALSQIAAGYAAAARCDRIVNTAVAGQALSKAFGGRSFSANETAEILKFTIGIQAMQAALGAAGTKSGCADAAAAFGPTGRTIKGLFD